MVEFVLVSHPTLSDILAKLQVRIFSYSSLQALNEIES